MPTVSGLFRYPVKSLQGRRVPELTLTPSGFEGDRRWALLDVDTGRLMSAKRWSTLLQASADDEGIDLPDGARVTFGDADADERLSAWLGREVHLAEADGSTEVSYEMTFDPPDDEAEYVPIPTPPGSFLDLCVGHLVAEPTLRSASERHPDLDWDVRRFRP
ncbi:MAG TPA: MOSC N-terminal beta barrel domain-containing protein, partial [Acidimicrobiales bacterium]|nr:MOSC N-terminal beta barrel domain-containing protein [Acidimicrobiales bacterium]